MRVLRTGVSRCQDLLKIGEAAAFLGVSSSTLRNRDRSGKVRAVRHPVNRYRLYRRADMEKLQRTIEDQS